MARITLNGKTFDVEDGTNLVEAARSAGVEIPTLCYLKKTGALASCMVCAVKELTTGRLVAACSTPAVNGMAIDTESEEVRAARREVLRMLLSEHLGDCRAPCSRICPASFRIPLMLRHIAAGNDEAAFQVARRDLILPATLGRVCSAPCEKGCRRREYDTAIPIRSVHGELAERFLAQPGARELSAPVTGRRIAVVGAGVAGIAAAATAARLGYACRVYEKRGEACGVLRETHAAELPAAILDAELGAVGSLGVEFAFHAEMGPDLPLESLAATFDAVIVTCGTADQLAGVPKNILHALEELESPIRSIAHGKTAARHAHALLSETPWEGRPRRYHSRLGKLDSAGLAAYAKGRVAPDTGAAPANRLANEAARCLHCDCLKPKSCKLRLYAEEYGLGGYMKREMPTPPMEALLEGGHILYESGKCIKCGICVELSRQGNGTGMAFEGRGLDSRVRPPFDVPLREALGNAAEDCVRACPTGALAFRNEEELP